MRGFAFCSRSFWVTMFVLCFSCVAGPKTQTRKKPQDEDHCLRWESCGGQWKRCEFEVLYHILCQSHRKKWCFSTDYTSSSSSSSVFLHLFLLIVQLVKMAKRLKKEKVNVDIINFGEEVRKSLYLPSYCYKSKINSNIVFFPHIWHFFPVIK